MNSNGVVYSALSYVWGSFELIEPTLPAFSKPALVTYPLNPPPEGDFAKLKEFGGMGKLMFHKVLSFREFAKLTLNKKWQKESPVG